MPILLNTDFGQFVRIAMLIDIFCTVQLYTMISAINSFERASILILHQSEFVRVRVSRTKNTLFSSVYYWLKKVY